MIIDRFLDIASEHPDRSALRVIVNGDWRDYSYRELSHQAERCARVLVDAGVKPKDAIILPSVRNDHLIARMLGILAVGAHYVFVDPTYPEERQQFIAKESGAKFIWGDGLACQGLTALSESEVLEANGEIRELAVAADPELPAYVMFTSGSTGIPKGVVVPQRAIARLVCDTDFIDFSYSQVFLLHSALSFDASTLEIWGALLNGGTCVVAPSVERITPSSLEQLLIDCGVSTLWLTSSFFNLVVNQNPGILHSLQQLLVGGEALSIPHIRKAQTALPELKIFNGYGPTENTTFTTTFEIPNPMPEDWTAVPIGYAIPGTGVEVVDSAGMPVAEGKEGELVAFGKGLALGYLNRPELTAEKFCECYRSDGRRERAYRTGDLACKEASGLIHYLGRNDSQVKIDGHRIETGEIEQALIQLDSVKDARVILVMSPSEQKRLAAYLVAEPNKHLDELVLRERLKSTLPAFMVPHLFVALDSIPVNQNGKLDREALPNPFIDGATIQTSDLDAANNSRDLNRLIAGFWQQILGRSIGDNSNFLEVGGTSLEAIELAHLIDQSLSDSVPETFVFQYPTIRSQVKALSKSTDSDNQEASGEPERQSNEFAVIGMACRLPGANNVDEFWENLLAGKESIRFFAPEELDESIPEAIRHAPNYVPAKGMLAGAENFDAPFFGVSPLEAKIMDPQQRVMLQLAWHALEDAGCAPKTDGADGGATASQQIGVFAGANWGRYFQQKVLTNPDVTSRYGEFNAALVNEPDFLSTKISYKLNLQGPSVNVYTACSTGLVAIAQACAAIEQGQCSVALAGGASVTTPLNAGYQYQEGGMLSKDGHCRPFDADATGTTFNDGAGFVVIKRLDLAERDGDDIHAVIKGYAVNNDGSVKASYTAPSVGGQVAVYDAALKKAGVAPESIGFIETHGTATPLGDPIEVASLAQSYRSDRVDNKTDAEAHRCAIGSVKSNIGHVIHAAGIASFIKATCAVKEGKIPGTAFFTKPNPKLKLDETPFFVNATTETWPISGKRRAAISSLGVGGTNAHVIIEAYQQDEERTDSPARSDEQHGLLTLSAKSERSLSLLAHSYQEFLSHNSKEISLAEFACASRQRTHFGYRAAFVATDVAQLSSQLDKLAKRETFDRAEKDLRPGFLFTGQGSQRCEMGSSWYQSNELFTNLFDQARTLLKAEFGFDLREIVFGDSTIDAVINQTQYAQPALFVFEVAMAKWLMRQGLEPEFLIGHSIGEYAAAVIADVMSFEDALRLVANRGQMMQSMPAGAMLAVKADIDKVRDLLPKGLDIAAENAPKLTVVSGETSLIEQFKFVLNGKDLEFTSLVTSHAFHSAMMEPMLAAFEELVSRCDLRTPKIPIYSTANGALLTDSDATSPAYWAQQIRQPVLYSKALRAAVEDSDRSSVAIEVGPGSTLASLATMHRLERLHWAKPASKSSLLTEVSASEPIKLVGDCWVSGINVSFGDGEVDGKVRSSLKLPLYQFDEKPYWLETPSAQASQAPAQQDASSNLSTLISQMNMLGASTNTSSTTTAEPTVPAQPKTQVVKMDSEQHLNSVKSKLIAVFEDVSGYELADMEADAHFSEVGLDSLILTQVAIELDQRFGGELTFRHLVEEYTCLGDLAAFYADLIPAETQVVEVPADTPAPNIPQASAAPVTMTATPNAIQMGANPNSSVMDLVNAQLQVMQMQLQALSGAPAAMAAPAPAQPVQTAPDATIPQQASSSSEKVDDDKPISSVTKNAMRMTRISKEVIGTNLTAAQQQWVDDTMAKFQKKFASSKELTQKHRKYFSDPRSVSGFNPTWKEIVFPMVIDRSEGSKIWDVDGNEFIDVVNGFGPILFGHRPKFIMDAVKEQFDYGIETGPQHPLAGEVAQLVCEITKNERCAYANTGSEAMACALRMVRTATGRDTVIMFEGSYHGIFDEMVARPGANNKAMPLAPGIPRSSLSNVRVLPWGDPESIEIIRSMKDERVAAVIVETVQSRNPVIQDAEYIKQIREATTDIDACLIFDEVVTGFRVAPGGIQERFGVEADMVTYGKILGGGFPIGLVAGKAKYLDALDGGYWEFGDESIPEAGVTFFAGTFLRHPAALAAAKQVLLKIKEGGAEMYQALDAKAERLSKEVNQVLSRLGCDITLDHFSSMFYVKVPADAHWGHLLYKLMLLEGVHIIQNAGSFLTTEHSEQDIDAIIAAFTKSISLLVSKGLVAGNAVEAEKLLKPAESAIPAGARLGKNANGEPAYFIEDPSNKGQYLEVGRP